MASTKDFRVYAFDAPRIDAAGKAVARGIYWKLYAIENLVRVITHSVLVSQLGATWWAQAVDKPIRDSVTRAIADYGRRPWHGGPGGHEIYYTYLSDLTKIITANSNQFLPHIPDIHQWIARLEMIRVPRNIVGHMNWLSATDRKRIDIACSDLKALVNTLASTNLMLSIP